MMKKSPFFLLLFPLVLNAGFFDWFEALSPKAQRAKDGFEGFDSLIEKALVDYQVPGLAVGVVVDGHVVYAKGFGYRDLEEKLPVTQETLFPIGSCTKAFTTFALGKFVDEGQIEWDQRMIDILPEFRLWDPHATTTLTLRDALTHRSGMPRHEFVWYNSKITREEMLKRLRYLKPSFEARQRYQYGNLMYFTAGLAMEQIAGKPWEEIIRERILHPLEMKNTNFSVEETQKRRDYAFPYIEKGDCLKKIPFRSLSIIGAAGSINSSIEEMTHWIQLHLSGGVYKSQVLISPATLQELRTPQVIIPGAPETKETLLYAYGIGWGVLSYRGYYFVSHDGVSDGFTSVVGLLPSEGIGVVVLANKNMTSLPRYLSFAIIDRILGLPFHDWFEEGAQSLRKNRETLKQRQTEEDRTRKKGTSPSHPIEEYVGVYEHPGYGTVSVDLVDGKLEATYNDLTFVLDHWHYDQFVVVEEKEEMIVSFQGAKFAFANNSKGEIGELLIPFEPSAGDIAFKRRSSEKHATLSYLRQFTGIYEIYGYVVEIAIRGQSLIAIIPGQPNYELVPAGENEFTVKTMTGSTVRFVLNSGQSVEEVLLIHPYGAFTAKPRKT